MSKKANETVNEFEERTTLENSSKPTAEPKAFTELKKKLSEIEKKIEALEEKLKRSKKIDMPEFYAINESTREWLNELNTLKTTLKTFGQTISSEEFSNKNLQTARLQEKIQSLDAELARKLDKKNIYNAQFRVLTNYISQGNNALATRYLGELQDDKDSFIQALRSSDAKLVEISKSDVTILLSSDKGRELLIDFLLILAPQKIIPHLLTLDQKLSDEGQRLIQAFNAKHSAAHAEYQEELANAHVRLQNENTPPEMRKQIRDKIEHFAQNEAKRALQQNSVIKAVAPHMPTFQHGVNEAKHLLEQNSVTKAAASHVSTFQQGVVAKAKTDRIQTLTIGHTTEGNLRLKHADSKH